MSQAVSCYIVVCSQLLQLEWVIKMRAEKMGSKNPTFLIGLHMRLLHLEAAQMSEPGMEEGCFLTQHDFEWLKQFQNKKLLSMLRQFSSKLEARL